MVKFHEKLESLLKTDDKFLDNEGELLKAKVIKSAEEIDETLIELLISDDLIKQEFFSKIKDVYVFNINHFSSYIKDKNFLNHSYTDFANKIGLQVNGDFLKSTDDVSLVFPYKDCILEGGQTKEEAGRKEIFFNKILAKDEINKLLSPKVLTNFEYWDEEQAKKWDAIEGTIEEKTKNMQGKEFTGFTRDENGTIKDNLLIKGNNLLSMHTIKRQFAGKVKLIYIDPPYNTENDGFKYNDNFSHSTWLTFMKNRLEVAKELLSDDGLIFVQCDYRENAYLKIVMDEVFGRKCFVNEITWKKYRGVKNQASRKLTTQQETILFFSKTENYDINFVYNPLSEKYVKDEYKYVDKDGRRYAKLRGRGFQGENGQAKIKYLDESLGSPISSLWDEDTLQLNTSASEKIKDFVGQKPEALIERIIKLSTAEGDIVLDYHSGTGTTASVAHKMKRQWIAIEQMDYIKHLPEARLKKVLAGEQGGISKSVNWTGGGSFVYMELAIHNQRFENKIKSSKTTKELLSVWEEMKEKGFLLFNIDIKKFDEDKSEFMSFELSKQKEFLCNMLDANMLYVPLSEAEDKQYNISDKDITLNKDFYQDEYIETGK